MGCAYLTQRVSPSNSVVRMGTLSDKLNWPGTTGRSPLCTQTIRYRSRPSHTPAGRYARSKSWSPIRRLVSSYSKTGITDEHGRDHSRYWIGVSDRLCQVTSKAAEQGESVSGEVSS